MQKDNKFDDSDSDDIPELEDMSKQIKELRKTTPQPVNQGDYTKTEDDLKKDRLKEQEELDKRLSKALLKKNEVKPKVQKKEEVIIDLKPDKDAQNPLQFKEVQENMAKSDLKAQVLSSKDKWLTEGLMQQVSTNPKLLSGFQDPETMQAIALMQTNPKEAMQKYKNNPKVTEFLIEFSKLMGGHFEELEKKEKKAEKNIPPVEIIKESKTKEQVELEKKLADPQVQALLQEEQIQNFLKRLQMGEPLDFYQLARVNPQLAQKVRFLLQKGVLQANFQK